MPQKENKDEQVSNGQGQVVEKENNKKGEVQVETKKDEED